MTTTLQRTKIDPAKLRLFSIPRKSSVGGGTVSPAVAAPAASRGASADPRISRTNTATSHVGSAAGVSRLQSRDTYSREGSRASALTKRSMSSEDARRVMKVRMSRPPDIQPVRGGNINIDNVTPEYVTEFWTRKKMESDEFKRRRLELSTAKKLHTVGTAAVGADPAPKQPPVRQPLRVSRPAAKASTACTTSDAKTRPPNPGTSPVQPKSPQSQPLKQPPRPAARTSSAGAARKTPVEAKGPVRSVSAASPAPSQPVARRLLVGSALGKRSVSPPQPQAEEGQPPTVSAAVAPPATAPADTRVSSSSSLNATKRSATSASSRDGAKLSSASASSPPKGILASTKVKCASRGPSPSGVQKRVHMDPAVAGSEPSDTAPKGREIEGLEPVF